MFQSDIAAEIGGLALHDTQAEQAGDRRKTPTPFSFQGIGTGTDKTGYQLTIHDTRPCEGRATQYGDQHGLMPCI
ncbi:hypothetical protein SDC9_162940 [bioreactor metagenome]|uniref:Uncharacterized protein n=1 Tax=bioreactor metagenome TaxID=1076179 RepID=A0A645FPH7_9ZZZZ